MLLTEWDERTVVYIEFYSSCMYLSISDTESISKTSPNVNHIKNSRKNILPDNIYENFKDFLSLQ